MTPAPPDPAPTSRPERPLVIFDGDCGFCRAWVHCWKQATGGDVDYEPYQEAAPRFPEIPIEEFKKAVQLVLPDGTRRRGAHAAFAALADVRGKGWMLRAYEQVPGFAAVSELGYRLIAGHRDLAYWITRIFWGVPVERSEQKIVSALFLRLLGVIYLIAFGSFGVQARGLIGADGILPIAGLLPLVRTAYGTSGHWLLPTVLWLNASDAAIAAVWVGGMVLAAILVAGIGTRFACAGCYVLYLSLVTAGQIFMGYQWDALLLEAGFLAIFLGLTHNFAWLYRWLLFRLLFMSGMVKLLSRDPTWRDLTALTYHYRTQPIPNAVAWYMNQMPLWFQKMSAAGTLAVELGVPFLFFLPRRARQVGALVAGGLQVLILLTGNYAFFNLLTLAMCLFLIDDHLLRRMLPAAVAQRLEPRPVKRARFVEAGRRAVGWSVAVLVVMLSVADLASGLFEVELAPVQAVRMRLASFEIVNGYGLFAVMTTSRPEIVFEGSLDGVNWREYRFKYKPVDVQRRPPWVAPHQPRLDWQLWFAALSELRRDPWVLNYSYRLLQGSPEVLDLMEGEPFPGQPPRYVRALLYEYRFTTWPEKQATGAWWHRELKGLYLPPVSLANFRRANE